MKLGIYSIVAIVFTITACDQEGESFRGGANQVKDKEQLEAKATSTPSPTPSKSPAPKLSANEIVQQFDFSIEVVAETNIDMVWTIDNSGSMGEEAEAVRNNLNSFMQSVQSFSDLKIALLSQVGVSNTQVTMPNANNNPNYIQFDYRVESNDPLGLAAIISCPANTSERTVGLNSRSWTKVCGQTLPSNFYTQSWTRTTTIQGALSSFFRPNTPRVYVFVTDDDSRNFSAQNFEDGITQNSNIRKEDLKVYNFASLSPSSTCTSVKSQVYLDLAISLSGESFNVCENDWSSHFSKLTDAVQEIVKNNFKLTEIPKEIKYVKLGSRLLTEGTDYAVSGKRLRILIEPTVEVQKIKIKYKHD